MKQLHHIGKESERRQNGQGWKALAPSALLVAMLLGPVPASALTVDVVPTALSVALGDLVQVDVRVSGLTDHAAPSLGAYDLLVDFNYSLLEFSHVTWGDQLDLEGLGSLTLFDDADADWGTLGVAEISYDSITLLNDQQAGSFTLFSLFFTASALGNAGVYTSMLGLSDAEGLALTADAVSGAQVAVVPVPAALPLLASGLLLLLGRLRRRT